MIDAMYLTPKQIVEELDKYIIGQYEAKRNVAIALRNRWRRMNVQSDMKNEIIRSLGDDEYVMSWVKGSATAKMDMPEMGLKAGQSHTGNSVEVSRYKDGKAVEHWSFMDVNEMMKMMGGGTAPPMENKMEPTKDTTSK